MRTYWLLGEKTDVSNPAGATAQANLPSISLSDTEGEPLPSPIPVNIQESTPSPMSPISDLGQDGPLAAAPAAANQPHITSNKLPSYYEATSQDPMAADAVPLKAAISCVNEVIRSSFLNRLQVFFLKRIVFSLIFVIRNIHILRLPNFNFSWPTDSMACQLPWQLC